VTPLATDTDRTAPPVELLTALRRTPEVDETTLQTWGLRALGGGRNNSVYLWTQPDGAKVCIKLYRRTDRNRVDREWHGLSHVANLACAPRPLWRDDHDEHPAIGMSVVPGVPIVQAAADPLGALKAVAETTRSIQELPLVGPLARLERVDSIGHYLLRLTEQWPGQLADAADDPQTRDMLALLRRWTETNDAAVLARPAPRVLSRGDANLLNWHADRDGRVYVVDWEFAGFSDAAVDAADHIEHISARALPDEMWQAVEADLGVDHTNRTRFGCARRTIALRWLAVLWKQRSTRVADFAVQHQRVRDLLA
jgi:hypothetical protein